MSNNRSRLWISTDTITLHLSLFKLTPLWSISGWVLMKWNLILKFEVISAQISTSIINTTQTHCGVGEQNKGDYGGWWQIMLLLTALKYFVCLQFDLSIRQQGDFLSQMTEGLLEIEEKGGDDMMSSAKWWKITHVTVWHDAEAGLPCTATANAPEFTWRWDFSASHDAGTWVRYLLLELKHPFTIKVKMLSAINSRDAEALRAAGRTRHPFKPWLRGELPSELAARENLEESEKWGFHAVKALCYAKLREVNHSTDPAASIKPSAEQVNKY